MRTYIAKQLITGLLLSLFVKYLNIILWNKRDFIKIGYVYCFVTSLFFCCVCILPSQSMYCQKASSALIEERRKREGQIVEQEMTKEGWIERMVKIV